MERYEQGLRCQDVHAGLHDIDPNSPRLVDLEHTRIVGMAGSVAALIRGRNVIEDAQPLKRIAAAELDVDPLAFDRVIEVLAESDLVRGVARKGGRIRSFTESVPYHQNLYDRLGEVWRDAEPTETESGVLHAVHALAQGPIPEEQLAEAAEVDPKAYRPVIEIATDADLVKRLTTPDGNIAYSPFFAFENPEALVEVLSTHGPDRMQQEFAEVRAYQGLPVDEGNYPLLSEAVARGLLTAPSVQRPDGIEQPFACAPYTIDRELLTVRKPILDKALRILSCIRCGEHFGGATAIRRPDLILDKLLDESRGHSLSAHSSARRQYQTLFRGGIIEFVPSGNWVEPRLIATEDNLAAVRLARELLLYGEPIEPRAGDEDAARRLLATNEPYRTPLQTVQRRRERKQLSDKEFSKAMDALMGRAAL
jgi:hypothetical protein